MGTWVFWFMAPFLACIFAIIYGLPLTFIVWLIDYAIGKPVLTDSKVAVLIVQGLTVAGGIATVIYLWKRWKAPALPTKKTEQPHQ